MSRWWEHSLALGRLRSVLVVVWFFALLAFVFYLGTQARCNPTPVHSVAQAEQTRPVAHCYAYGQSGTGLWMHGKLPDSSLWKPGDTLLLETGEARWDE